METGTLSKLRTVTKSRRPVAKTISKKKEAAKDLSKSYKINN